MKSQFSHKSLRVLALAALLLSGQACKDVLKETVISNIGNDYIKTPKGFEDASKAAYSSLRNFYASERGLTMTEYGTDIYQAGADGSYKGFHFYDTQMNSFVDIIQQVWEELYRGINTCNAVIERAPAATVSDATKKLRVAEMKFLRAHYYFILVQQFGGVDLRLTETILPTKKTSRATEADIYKSITSDLESALADLPTVKASSQGASDYGRATKSAAEHLLARVYLTKATSSAKAADDYTKAATYAQNVISNYSLKLLPDFASVFAQGGGEINDEVIFSVQYTTDPLTNINTANTNNGDGNKLHLYFGMQYDVQPGMKRDIANDRPFKRLRPTTYLLETVFKDRVNDSRYKKTFKDTWLSNNPGTNLNTSFDNSKAKMTLKAGDTAIYIPGVEWTVAQRAAKPYQVLVPSAYTAALFPTLQKFLDPTRPDLTYEQGSRDYLAFRLAETYLILAEAQFKSGKTTEATAAINAVRRRAAWPGKESAMEITPAQLDMEMIMQERARELAGEQMRWFDLKRWGNLVERVKLYNPDGAANVKETHNLRPIPQTQIDRTENGGFKQNDGF
ncbi:RagB/SusD family nutrient uptake outer membrane protein [Spirosoma sp. KCTC 42546]|uniref:RagB/SusD family nutrient uptake outer membrane protein n=1 Tax=Spirosoma sp. KCTC 42546 TaxID=2520506 RepID=UPI001158CF6F|nr:RagB/SusD family nutrient uptake outer membrane protein [Spirosoma sp. KCTC 42546]QDK78469.1 RagB/SusD family nutrient uptake outer membrane protein [Spirosoma sp. KCTC 42546]